MTPQRAKELLPIIAAFAEGKTIQHKHASHENWADGVGLGFNLDHCNYRIKPEPKPRPWTAEEVPVGAVLRKIADPKSRVLLTGTDKKNIYGAFTYALNYTSHASLLAFYEHSTDGGRTWLPCGVLES